MRVDVIGSVRELYRSDDHRRMADGFVVTVAIPFANNATTIAETVVSLVEQRAAPAFELLLVSNNTSDASVKVAVDAGVGLPLRVVECESVGYDANARNVSFVEASANKIIFIDADDVASPDYVARMSDALDRHPLVTGVWSLPRLNAPIFPDVSDIVPIAADTWPFREEGWPYAPTGTLGLRRDVVEVVGGFRLDIGVSGNNEWCFRAHARGFEIVPVLDAVQHYRLRRTAREMFWQRYNYGVSDVAARKAAVAFGLPRKRFVSAAGLGTYRRIAESMIKARTAWDWYKVAGRIGTAFGHAVGSVKYRYLDL